MTFCVERGILKQYNGHDTTVVIPPDVTEIGYRSFYQNPEIRTVILSEGVKKVGMQAFAGCNALNEIVFPESICTIGHEAFANTAWLDWQPDGVVYAGPLAWMIKGDLRSIDTITIKPGTLKLCADLFRNCTALTQVILPESLREIDDRAFQNCRKLKTIRIPEMVTRIGDRAFDECVKLSVQIDAMDVTLGRHCFMDDASLRLEHIHPAKVPVNVRNSAICTFADDYCNENVRDAAFARQMIQYIQNRRRQYYSLAVNHWNMMQMMIQERVIPLEDVDDLLDAIFSQGEADHAAALLGYKQSLTAEDDLDAFSDPWDDLSLDWDVPLPEKTVLQMEAEWGMKQNTDGTYTLLRYYGAEREVVIPVRIGDKVITAIGPYALSPHRYGIKHESAVRLEHIYSVTIPDGITRIGNHAFAGCKGLVQIVMPDSIEQIGKDAFAQCPLLQTT